MNAFPVNGERSHHGGRAAASWFAVVIVRMETVADPIYITECNVTFCFIMNSMDVQLLEAMKISICRKSSVLPNIHFPLASLHAFDATEDRHFWFQERKELVEDIIWRYLSQKFPLHILDVGCGNGGLLQHLQSSFEGVRLAGIDAYPQALLHTRKRCVDAVLFLEDITQIDSLQLGGQYDVVIFADVLEHLDNPDAALQTARSLLNHGGIVIGLVPASMLLWSERDVFLGHRLRYTRNNFQALFERQGFHVLEKNYLFSHLYLFVLLHRKIISVLQHKAGADIEKEELRIIPAVNSLLRWIGRMEIALARRFPLPFGTSVYCVAQKL